MCDEVCEEGFEPDVGREGLAGGEGYGRACGECGVGYLLERLEGDAAVGRGALLGSGVGDGFVACVLIGLGVGGDGRPLFLELVDRGYVRGAGCEDFGERLAAEGEAACLREEEHSEVCVVVGHFLGD